MKKEDIVALLSEVELLGKYLTYDMSVPPEFRYVKTISNKKEFIEWKERVKYIFYDLKQEPIIIETLSLLNGFNGCNDEKDFYTLISNIKVIVENISRYLKSDELTDANHNDSSKPSVFVSYNETSGGAFVEELKIQISETANLHIYKDDMHAWESLKEFMKTIRHQDFVILVITDQYLKSEACLYEITELIKDDNWDGKTMFCVLDKSIYDKSNHIKYIKYWDKQAKDLDKQISQIPNSASSSQCERLKQLRRATDEIGQFLSKVSDSNNPNQYSAIRIIRERLEGVHNE